MFQVLVGMKKIGEFPQFIDAFKLFFSKVLEWKEGGGNTLQWLETTNFIVCREEGFVQPMGFYDSRDFAYDIGLLAGDGEVQEGVEEPSPEIVRGAFVKVMNNYLNSQIKELSALGEEIIGELK